MACAQPMRGILLASRLSELWSVSRRLPFLFWLVLLFLFFILLFFLLFGLVPFCLSFLSLVSHIFLCCLIFFH